MRVYSETYRIIISLRLAPRGQCNSNARVCYKDCKTRNEDVIADKKNRDHCIRRCPFRYSM